MPILQTFTISYNYISWISYNYISWICLSNQLEFFGAGTTCAVELYQIRDDYNGLTSDIFQTILLNVQPLMHYLSNTMYGCPIKLGTNVAINGICPIISEIL